MTLAALPTVLTYAGDGSASPLPVTFAFFAAADLEVVEVAPATGAEAARVLGTHYAVAGGGGSAGTVTPLAARPAGTSWRIRRRTPREQQADYDDAAETPLATLERSVDRLAAMAQELGEEMARAVRVPAAEHASATPRELPRLADRAGRLARFADDGRLVAHEGAADPDLAAYDLLRVTAAAVPRSLKGKLSDFPDVRDYGAVPSTGNAHATANSAAFALAQAQNPTRPVYVPPGHFKLDDEPVLGGDGAGFFGAGDSSVVEQVTAGRSLFRVVDTDFNVLRDLRLLFAGTKAAIGGSFEGNPARERAAAVYAKDASHLECSGLRVKGFVVGVRLRVEDEADDVAAYNRVLNCRFDRVDYGILTSNQDTLLIHGIMGDNTDFSQTGAPPHLIYLGGDETTDRKSENVVIADCVDRNNPHASSYKARNVEGLALLGLWSKDCTRGIDLTAVDGFSIHGCGTLGLLAPSATDTQRAGVLMDACSRGVVSGATVTLVDDLDDCNGIFARNGSTDILVIGSRVKMRRTSSSSSYAPFRADQSSRIIFADCHAIENGANKYLFRITGGDRCRLVHPFCRNDGGGRVLQVDGGATNVLAKLDRGLFQNAATSGEVDAAGAGAGCVVTWDGQFATLPPLPTAPADVQPGTLAVSDGTGGGFDASSGAGLYRRTAGGAWAFIG